MATDSSILTVGTFVSAFVGALLGVLLDRFWRRIESRALLRVQVGAFQGVKGEGRTLTITNVGLDPLPEYGVALFHPQRGSLQVFHGEASELVFPQYPDQQNKFRCSSRPGKHTQEDSPSAFIKKWFLTVGDKPIAAPSFVSFRLRLIMRNSEVVLFEDEGLGNYVAKQLYEDAIGGEVEQQVSRVFYRSKAPFWVEWIRTYRSRRMIRRVEKEGRTTN